MQQEEVLDFICPDHQEKIKSVQLSETEENKMYSLKCLTQKQVPIEELTKQLKELRIKGTQELIENKEVEINVQSNEDDKTNKILEQQKIQEQYQLKQYQLIKEEKKRKGGWAMAMNQDETILLYSQGFDIQIWLFSSDGQLNLKQTLSGHTSVVTSLYFSKKSDMFISGSWDHTIRVWQTNDQDQWYCTQTLEGHEDWIRYILLDNDDDQLISCGEDQKIKIWMRQKDNDQWKCVQTLIQNRLQVFCISLSCDCNQLASTDFDGLRIWSKGSDKVWKKYQLILQNNDYFLRIKYINNNELIVSTQGEGRLIRFIKNNQGLYELISQLQLNILEEFGRFWFPIIYNQQLGLVLLRHSDKHTYLLKKQNNGEFIIHQVFNGDYASGYITKDSRICIQSQNKLEIWKNE